MSRTIMFLIVVAASGIPLAHAEAGMPALNHTCPSLSAVKVTAKAGGPVFINGKQASVRRISATYFEASSTTPRVTVSILAEPGSAPSLSYTGPGKLNGICQPSRASAVAPAKDSTAPARKSCLAAVAKTTGKPAAGITIIDAAESQAGVVINLKVPGAAAPWRCISSREGKVGDVMFTGSEGKL